MNEATPAASLVAKIADTYNTGWMPGDIRRAYLADTAVGALADGSTVADRSYKGAALQVHGTLTRTKVGGVSVYSSFSNTNYLQESASSTDLDPATGALHKSFFGSLPAVLPASNFPPVSGEKVVNGSFDTDTDWNKTNPATISIAGGKLSFNNAASGEAATSAAFLTTTAGNWHLLTITTSNWIGLTNLSMRTGAGAFTIINCAPGAGSTTQTILFKAGIGGQTLSLAATSNGCTVDVESISIMEVGPAIAFDRSAAAGAFYRGGCWPDGTLTFSIGDGTTTRTVTSPASYAGVRVKASMSYGTDGTLAFNVNGVQVAATTGTPLGSLSNASAVLTVGNSRDLNAAWPGDLALLKIGMTNPSADASAFMYDTERLMFADGAVCTLPDSGAVVDMDYDALTGKLKVASAANESSFNWLNRVSSAPVSAGSISKVTTKSGIKLVTRTGTNAGVDITIPPKNLQEELNKRAQDAARLAQITQAFDWNGGFTATTAVGSTALTGATGLSIPSGATAVGARVSGTGIPAGAYVTAVVGTTVYISAAATAAGTVPVSFVDVILPVGFEVAADVVVARQLQYEGSTYDYQRAFDGIRERASFNSGAYPAATARVRINARRAA